MKVLTHSVVTCPNCKAEFEEEMPTDACLFYLECRSCHSLLRPNTGDCCVFCSYGNVKCPPVQLRQETYQRGPLHSATHEVGPGPTRGVVVLGIAIPSSSPVFLSTVVVDVIAGLSCTSAGVVAMLASQRRRSRIDRAAAPRECV
jgi:hypothetical protein